MAAKKQKREMTIVEHVKKLDDSAPPLTEEQEANLARLFRAA